VAPTFVTHGALNAADGCPLSGGNRTPWVQRGIDAISRSGLEKDLKRGNGSI
jgi:hypothetical protein